MTLQLKNVTVRYGKKTAANSVNIAARNNGLHGIFGPNGSGKSSIIKAICGLEEYGGKIEFFGKDAKKYRLSETAKLLAYVPQHYEFIYGYRAIEIVMMGDAGYRGFAAASVLRDSARNSLAFLGAESLEDRPITELSGGERQLVHIARAFNQNTPLLILDEPFSHLDFGNQIALWKKLKNMSAEKIIVTTSHDPNHITWFCDSISIIKNGEMSAQQSRINLHNIETLYPGQWQAGTLGSGRNFFAPDI